MRLLITAAMIWLEAAKLGATAPTRTDPHVGDVFIISRNVETTEEGPNNSNGSSTDHDDLVERVIRISDAGVELEYDLSKDTSKEDRARQWQFPARILRTRDGQIRLLNANQIVARAASWLRAAGLTSAACGKWYFTWDVFQITCDPQSVIGTIEGFNLGPAHLMVGSSYQETEALGPVLLRAKGGPSILFGEGAINPEIVRRARAKSDVVAAEVLRKPISLADALKSHSREQISGSIAITFKLDANRSPQQRLDLSTITTEGPDGRKAVRSVRQSLERRLVSGPKGLMKRKAVGRLPPLAELRRVR